MQDRFKFRVWRELTKSYCDASFGCAMLRNGRLTNSEDGLIAELMYDGSLDANGKEFFQGDTVKVTTMSGDCKGSVIESEVEYSCGCFKVCGNLLSDLIIKGYKIEIIGTIHDEATKCKN